MIKKILALIIFPGPGDRGGFLIGNAIGQFKKYADQVRHGQDMCREAISLNKAQIQRLDKRNMDLHAEIARGELFASALEAMTKDLGVVNG